MTVRINKIVENSKVDGPGERTVVFFQGCTIRCPGCQNRSLWPADGGHEYMTGDLAKHVAAISPHGNVTISGGEPFAQPQALLSLVARLKELGVKHIIVYSGYTWEQLTSPMSGIWITISFILDHVDVVVDGPFIKALDHDKLTWRGSSNQRPIDVKATREAGQVVTLDWDNQLTIGADGTVIAPFAFAQELAEVGTLQKSRMCGQTRGA